MTVFSLVTLMPWGWFSLFEWFTTSSVVFLTKKQGLTQWILRLRFQEISFCNYLHVCFFFFFFKERKCWILLIKFNYI